MMDGLVLPQTYLDHLYDYVELDTAIHSLLQRPFLATQIRHLMSLSQLGLMSYLYGLAKHSKWEHCLGVYHLSRLCADKLPRGSHINPEVLKAAALLHGIGHFPLAYAIEWGLTRLWQVDRRRLRALTDSFRRVERSFCGDCPRTCWRNLLDKQRVSEIVRWLSAAAIQRDRGTWTKAQKRTFKPLEVIRYLVCPKTSGYQLLWKLDLLDYVQRDLFYLGSAKLNINVDYLFARLHVEDKSGVRSIEFPPEWRALKAMHTYLEEDVYRSPSVAGPEFLLANAFAAGLADGRVRLDDLRTIDDEDALGVLSKCMPRAMRRRFADAGGILRRAREGAFVEIARENYVYGPVKSPFQLEQELMSARTGRTAVEDSCSKGALVIADGEEGSELYNVRLLWDSTSKSAPALLRALGRFQRWAQHLFTDVRPKVASWLFGLEAEIMWSRYRELLAPGVAAFKARKTVPVRILGAFLEDKEYASWLQFVEWRGSDQFTQEEWVVHLSDCFVRGPEKFTEAARSCIMGSLSGDDEKAKELSQYVESTLIPLPVGWYRWTMPSVVLVGRDGRPEAELDGVAVEVGLRGPARLSLREVTTSESNKKISGDKSKLRKCRRWVERRLADSVIVELFVNQQEVPRLGRPKRRRGGPL